MPFLPKFWYNIKRNRFSVHFRKPLFLPINIKGWAAGPLIIRANMDTNSQILKPVCLEKITPADLKFMSKVLSSKRNQKRIFEKLLCDLEIRNKMLDTRKVLNAVLELNSILTISAYLYFYVLVRHIFLKQGIDERVLADYVATLLVESLNQSKTADPSAPRGHPFPYITDMLALLENAGPHESLRIHTDIGNHTLFLTGLLRHFIRSRKNRRGAPGIRYYEEMGMQSFKIAGRTILAEKLEMEGIYLALASMFTEIRRSLNQMTNEYLFLFETEERKKVERLLRDIDAID